MSELTRDDAIVIAAEKVLSSLPPNSIKCKTDLEELKQKIVAETQDAIDEHNAVCDKSRKWKMQQDLTPYQIKLIMLKVFKIKRINMHNGNSQNGTIAGVYIDDLVLEIAGDSYKNKKGLYCIDVDLFKCLIEVLDVNALPRAFDELLKKISISAPITCRCSDRDLIAVGNGIFNYKTKQLMDFNSDLVFLSKSPISYNPLAANVTIHNSNDGTDWDYESWIESLSDDKEVQDLLKMIPSCLLRPQVRFHKALLMVSASGNNGKGSLLEAWRCLLGTDSYCSISLADFGKDFALETLMTAQAVLTDENDTGAYLDRCANLKAVITNDVLQLNAKFKSPITFQFRGFVVQCLNESVGIRMKDKSDSMYRRLLPIPMDKCFTGQERKYIKDDYLHRTEVLEYIMKTALEGTFYELPTPQCSVKLLGENKELNDPVREFWNEMRDRFVWDLLPFEFLYALYKSWFNKNSPSGTVIGSTTFKNDLLSVLRSDCDDMWFCEDKTKKVYLSERIRMNEPEHLIHEYGLSDWMSKAHKGNNIDQLCMPNLSASYRGLQRIK